MLKMVLHVDRYAQVENQECFINYKLCICDVEFSNEVPSTKAPVAAPCTQSVTKNVDNYSNAKQLLSA